MKKYLLAYLLVLATSIGFANSRPTQVNAHYQPVERRSLAKNTQKLTQQKTNAKCRVRLNKKEQKEVSQGGASVAKGKKAPKPQGMLKSENRAVAAQEPLGFGLQKEVEEQEYEYDSEDYEYDSEDYEYDSEDYGYDSEDYSDSGEDDGEEDWERYVDKGLKFFGS